MQIFSYIEKYLGIEENEGIDTKMVIALCILGYLFGVICRCFYLWVALTDARHVLLDGFPMINTEDGYFFARLIVNTLERGHTNLLWENGGYGFLIAITSLGYLLTPFTLEQIAVVVPVIIAPLVAIPFVLLGRLLGNSYFGFIAGITVSLSSSFFRRTSFSYFDSDLFALTAPALVVLVGTYVLLKPNLRTALLASLIVAFCIWVDKGAILVPLYLTFGAMFIIMHFRNPEFFKLLILLCIPLLTGFRFYELFLISLGAYGVLFLSQRYTIPFIDERSEKIVWGILAITFLMYVLWNTPIFDSIKGNLQSYGTTGRGVTSKTSSDWSFYKVTGTIVEARTVNLQELIKATGDYFYLFIIGIVGACFALIRFPVLFIGSGLLGAGLFSLYGGVRFSMYLIPILAMGLAYMIMLSKKYINLAMTAWKEDTVKGRARKFFHHYITKYSGWLVALMLSLVVLHPKITAAYNQYPRTVARLPQVEMLQNVNEVASSDDYIISWWDYGYVMNYYSDMRTLIDGGKHNQDNYIVSKAFASTSQALAANLIREAIEAYATGTTTKAVYGLFGKRRDDFQPNRLISEMAQPDYVLQRPETRDIYLYIPYQMLRIYGVVRYFSDLNLVSGELQQVPFINTQNYRIDRQSNRILLPGNTVIDLTEGTVSRGNQVVGKVNNFYHHQVRNNQSEMKSYRLNSLANFSVILSDYYRIVYVGGPQIINSNFVQMFFFKNYDKNYFELVDENPLAVLYKLKKRGSPNLEQSQINP